MKTILSWVGAIAVSLVIGFLFGMNERDKLYQKQLAIATAAFEQRVKEANDAYAGQRVKDDKELADLRAQASTAPPNTTIVVKKDMAKRIRAIK